MSTKIEPHEAKSLPLLPPETDEAMKQIATGVSGFVYPGDRLDAVICTIRLLRAYPDLAKEVLA